VHVHGGSVRAFAHARRSLSRTAHVLVLADLEKSFGSAVVTDALHRQRDPAAGEQRHFAIAAACRLKAPTLEDFDAHVLKALGELHGNEAAMIKLVALLYRAVGNRRHLLFPLLASDLPAPPHARDVVIQRTPREELRQVHQHHPLHHLIWQQHAYAHVAARLRRSPGIRECSCTCVCACARAPGCRRVTASGRDRWTDGGRKRETATQMQVWQSRPVLYKGRCCWVDSA
jgi:hypothetical protein